MDSLIALGFLPNNGKQELQFLLEVEDVISLDVLDDGIDVVNQWNVGLLILYTGQNSLITYEYRNIFLLEFVGNRLGILVVLAANCFDVLHVVHEVAWTRPNLAKYAFQVAHDLVELRVVDLLRLGALK